MLRSKEALVAIRPVDGVLCLETMRYADEVLAPDSVLPDVGDAAPPTERELEMARQLVKALAGEFDPEKYHDEYREELLALIDRKAAGEEIVASAAPEEPAKVLDLMARSRPAWPAPVRSRAMRLGSQSRRRARRNRRSRRRPRRAPPRRRPPSERKSA